MPARSVYLETFGCQMNELDSELVAGQLRAMGYRFVSEPETADVILYNTCSVREHAEQKVWSRLGLDRLRKQREPHIVVGVLGCMAERDGEDLIKRMPVVDILCGPGELDKLPGLLDNAVRTRDSLLADEPTGRNTEAAEQAERSRECLKKGEAGDKATGQGLSSSSLLSSAYSDTSVFPPEILRAAAGTSARQVALQGSTSRRSGTLAAAQDTLEMLDLSRAVSPSAEHKGTAYVRITRGCNKFCTYCVVPFTRGAEVHRPPEHIIDECRKLADAGVIEITLLGQTVNHYRFEHSAAVTVNGIIQPQKGRSYAGGAGGHRADPFRGSGVTTFADLLARIHDEVPAIQRLRFVTSYPRDFGDDVLQVIRDHPRICRYLHVPAQSGSNSQLKAMNRGYTVEEYLEFLDRARSFLHQPEIGRPLAVAGDIIVGFPGETDDDFEATARLLEKARYKNCFIFKYSPRPGTVAYDKLPDDVPEAVKRRRNNELLALQQRISAEVGAEYVGMELDVFIEGLSRREVKRAVREAAGAEGHSHANGRASAGIALTIGGRPLGSSEAVHETPSACAMPPLSEDEAPAADEATGERGIQLSARTDGDLIVHIDLPADQAAKAESLVGKIARCRITQSRQLSLVGELCRQ